MGTSLSALTLEILQFRDERDWAQFHSPRQLAAALAIEAAELQELLLWKTDDESRDLLAGEPGVTSIRHEVADILIYALLMAAEAGIDPAAAIREKLAINSLKYPVAESRGRATKYKDLPHAGQSVVE